MKNATRPVSCRPTTYSTYNLPTSGRTTIYSDYLPEYLLYHLLITQKKYEENYFLTGTDAHVIWSVS